MSHVKNKMNEKDGPVGEVYRHFLSVNFRSAAVNFVFGGIQLKVVKK